MRGSILLLFAVGCSGAPARHAEHIAVVPVVIESAGPRLFNTECLFNGTGRHPICPRVTSVGGRWVVLSCVNSQEQILSDFPAPVAGAEPRPERCSVVEDGMILWCCCLMRPNGLLEARLRLFVFREGRLVASTKRDVGVRPGEMILIPTEPAPRSP